VEGGGQGILRRSVLYSLKKAHKFQSALRRLEEKETDALTCYNLRSKENAFRRTKKKGTRKSGKKGKNILSRKTLRQKGEEDLKNCEGEGPRSRPGEGTDFKSKSRGFR